MNIKMPTGGQEVQSFQDPEDLETKINIFDKRDGRLIL